MAEPVREAMAGDQAAKLREGLNGRFGELESIGEAWAEDPYQGYRSFRVPVRFGDGNVDLRVVLDGEDLVIGLFVVPHAEPPPPSEKTGAGELAVTIGPAERGLPGALTLPDGEGPFPAVLLVHGSGPQDRDETIGPNKPFRDLARGLRERGIAVLRYDKRSYARPEDLLELEDALTVEQEVIDDARSALALLREREAIDPRRVFVLGHSLGGTVSPRIAAGDAPPAGLIVMAGMTLPLPEKIVEQMRYIAGLDGEPTAEEEAELAQIEELVGKLRQALDGEIRSPAGPVLGAPVGYYADLEEHDPPAEAAALELPILVLQGERDYQVTMRDFALWRAALADRPAACLATYAFREGSGASGPQDYDRRAPVDDVVIDDIAAWIHDGRCP
jgi:dienelactone hydrolase